jgi:hypothetical protein
MNKYNEIFRLKEMLEKAEIPFEFGEYMGGYHLCYPKKNDPDCVEKETFDRVCSVIEHDGSYGREQDLLEIMGLLTDKELQNDDVVGYLSAENVFERIKKHYEGR